MSLKPSGSMQFSLFCCSHFVPNPLSFCIWNFKCIFSGLKQIQIPIFRIFCAFLANLRLFVKGKPFTKNVCFQNFMIEIEKFYDEKNDRYWLFGFLYFQNKFNFLDFCFTIICDCDWRLCPKGQMFCICRTKYSGCQSLPILTGCAHESP